MDVAIRKAESNLYWQDEFVENAYRAFSKGGEEYGFAKQRLMQYLKDLKNRELNKVKGYETEDFDVDLVDAILKAQEAEPERATGDESKFTGEEAEEELEESGGAFEGDEERLLTNPLKFYKQDKEYFIFTITQLRRAFL